MTFKEAFKESEFIKRGYWQGKFMHEEHGKLVVSHYPGSSYNPATEDLAAEDWVEFEIFETDVVV